MLPWETQQMSQTYLLKNLKYPWKLLVVMHLGSIARMKNTTEAYTVWKYKDFLVAINIKTNGAVQQRHHQRFIDEK